MREESLGTTFRRWPTTSTNKAALCESVVVQQGKNVSFAMLLTFQKIATIANAWSVGPRFRSLSDEKDKLQMQISACQPCDLHGTTDSLD